MSLENQSVSPLEDEPMPPWMREVEERYRAYLMAEKRAERTIDLYARYFRALLKWIGRSPETWTKADMQRFKEHVAPGISSNTLVVEVSAINQYTQQVLERPDLKLRYPTRVKHKERTPLTEDEVQRILDEAKKRSKRDYAIFCLIYSGELRASEVASLWVDDFDPVRKKVRVKGKGGDYDHVNLSDAAVGALLDYINGPRSKTRPATQEAEKVLVLSVNGRPMTRSEIWRLVKRGGFEAGIKKDVFPHIFRHSAITHMAEKGLSVYSIQAQSRHKNLGALQKYIHMSQKTVREDYDRVFNSGKSSTPKQPDVPSVVPAPESIPQDDKLLSDLATLLSRLSQDKRQKISSMLRSYEPRIELTGG